MNRADKTLHNQINRSENILTKYDDWFEQILRIGGTMGGGPGYLLTKEVSAKGIARAYLYDYLSRHSEIHKLDRGIYYRGSDPDNYYVLSLHKKVIFSHASAAYLHGLLKEKPSQPEVCLPAGYNKGRMRGDPEAVSYSEGNNLKIHLVSLSDYKEDTVKIKTRQGHIVTAYCIEKTLCQLVHNSSNLSDTQYYDAVKTYFKMSSIDHMKLRFYAKKYKVENTIFEYYNLLR